MSLHAVRTGKRSEIPAVAVAVESLESRTLLSASPATAPNLPASGPQPSEVIVAADGPISVTETFPVIATERNSSGRVPLARFTYATAAGGTPPVASDFIATVLWGEGAPLAATVSGTAAEGFVVSGEHTYALEGQYPITIRVAGPEGATAEAVTAARVLDAVIFQPRVDFSVASGRHAAADFNNDGAPDLITASDLQYTVLLNGGNGDLTPKPSLALPGTTRNGAMHIATADFNSDGKQDAAISLLGHTGVPDQLAVMLGRGDGTFTTSAVYPDIGGDDLEAGDINGDGLPDLAAVYVNRAGGNAGAGVLLGRGDGTFDRGATVTAPTTSVDAVELKDFDGDSKLDLIQSDWLGGNLLYARGRGDGTFAAPLSIPVPLTPRTWGYAVTSGDFNGDGRPDVAAAQSIANQLTVLLNKGDGTFEPPTLTPLTTESAGQTQWVFFLHAADANGDGALDLLRGDAAGKFVAVRLGRGDGTFLPDQRFDVQTDYFVDVAAADFNRDGRADLAAGKLSVFLSTPLLAAAAAPVLVEGAASDVLLATFIHDESDAPAGAYSASVDWGDGAKSPASVSTAPGGGFELRGAHAYRRQGNYQARVTLLGPGGARTTVPVRVSVTDAPIVVTGTSPVFGIGGSPTGAVPLGTFRDADGEAVFGPYSANIAWGDGQTSQGTAHPVPGAPAGTFEVRGSHTYAAKGTYEVVAEIVDAEGGARATVTTPARVVDPYDALPAVQYQVLGAGLLGSGDVNGDDVPDVVTAIDNYISVLMGRGDGTLAAPVTTTLNVRVGSLALGDFNGDGKLDLLHDVSPLGGGATPPRTAVLLGNGDGTFAAAPTAEVFSLRLAVADFNNDGKLDAVTSGTPDGPGLMIGRGDGTFVVSSLPLPGRHSYEEVVAVDFNGDGRMDIAASRNQSSLGEPNQVIVLAGRGDGTFAAPAEYPMPSGQPASRMYLVSGDFNADGKPDLAGTDPYRRVLSVLLNNGDGSFTAVPNAPLEDPAGDQLASGQPAAADVNGDGLDDLVLPNRQDSTVRVRLGRGDGTFMPDARYPVAQVPGLGIVVTDLNGDAIKDVVASATGSRTISVLIGTPALLTRGPAAQAREGTDLVDLPLGTLTFRDPPGNLSGVSATIDWGDGTLSRGRLSPAGGGSFQLRGTHMYAHAGTYVAKATVALPHGVRPTASTTVVVTDAPIDAVPLPATAPLATPFTMQVAQFVDRNPFGSAGEFSATIDWGDGRPAPAVVALQGPGTYAVLGTNTFDVADTRNARVTITSEDGSTAVVMSKVQVVAPRNGGGSISGNVFDDADGDGVREFGEGGMAGRTVYIDGNRNDAPDAGEPTALTSAAGHYTLADVPGGDWVVRQVLRPGDRETSAARGSGLPVNLRRGEVVAGVDLGARREPAVAGRHLFYNSSVFDGNNAGVGIADDAAVASQKQALLPGATAAARNVGGYTRGINGVMVDVAGLPAGEALSADDFEFKTGVAGDPAGWAVGPAPTGITVRRGAGVNGTDRVTLVFPDNMIRNTWLRVTVKPTADSGLGAPDVFYFGNLVGDAGGPGTPRVDARDLALTRAAIGKTSAAALDTYDFNRDGRVNALDRVLVLQNQGRTLPLFTAPPSAPAAAQQPGAAGEPVVVPPSRRSVMPPRRDALLREPPRDLLA